MELITPGIGLIFWQLMTILSIPCFMVAWLLVLFTNKLNPDQKIVWLVSTLFLPVIGPLIFFVKYPFFKKANA
ncbi:PLDc N-terminal domain-containing protein [Pontibacter anaerobius]|uniref:Cardiolipin synthase N-terminal domain-containing protein n=1 Tax=Pontibacter anaerobius TaxID=2993940 RepID=A0ABT3RAD0_9BACT|nr:PLDc N-terminal domain-containing protein [Pontibacter anaerobius]MCX2738396.1 hypothetical protein [Pontibacter anaerobius]